MHGGATAAGDDRVTTTELDTPPATSTHLSVPRIAVRIAPSPVFFQTRLILFLISVTADQGTSPGSMQHSFSEETRPKQRLYLQEEWPTKKKHLRDFRPWLLYTCIWFIFDTGFVIFRTDVNRILMIYPPIITSILLMCRLPIFFLEINS